MPYNYQVKEIPINGVAGKCIIVPPRSGYTLPHNLTAAGLNGATELWRGMVIDFENKDGGEITPETTSTTGPTDRIWLGVRSLSTYVPGTFPTNRNYTNSEWFAGYGSAADYASKLELSGGTTRRYSPANYFGVLAASAYDNGTYTVGNNADSVGTIDMDTTGTSITAPTKALQFIGRLNFGSGRWAAYGSSATPMVSVATSPTLASLESGMDTRYLARASSWAGGHGGAYAPFHTGGSATQALSGATQNFGFYVYNPFINNAIRIHAVHVKKYA